MKIFGRHFHKWVEPHWRFRYCQECGEMQEYIHEFWITWYGTRESFDKAVLREKIK